MELTFKAACAVEDSNAHTKQTFSNIGEFHDAAPMPNAMGNKVNNVVVLGNASRPPTKTVNKTIMSGIPHFDV